MDIANEKKMENFQHDQRIHRHGLRHRQGIAAVKRIAENTENRRQEKAGHQQNMPDESAGEDRRIAWAWWACHGPCLGRFKRQRQAEGDRRNQVHPEDLHGGDRQGQPCQKRQGDHHGLPRIGGESPADHLFQIVIDCPSLTHCGGDGGEIIICENKIGGLLRCL